MTNAVLSTFFDSYDRCQRHGDFIDRFYERFIGASPEAAAHFAETDFRRQRRMLHTSLVTCIYACEGSTRARRYLERLRDLHAEMNIEADLYDVWLESLIATVRTYDPRFSPAIEEAWRKVMGVAIAILQDNVATG